MATRPHRQRRGLWRGVTVAAAMLVSPLVTATAQEDAWGIKVTREFAQIKGPPARASGLGVDLEAYVTMACTLGWRRNLIVHVSPGFLFMRRTGQGAGDPLELFVSIIQADGDQLVNWGTGTVVPSFLIHNEDRVSVVIEAHEMAQEWDVQDTILRMADPRSNRLLVTIGPWEWEYHLVDAAAMLRLAHIKCGYPNADREFR